MIVPAFRLDHDTVDIELVLIPPAHDFKAGTTMRYMIDGCDRLSDKSRRRQRDVNSSEQPDPFGQRTDGGAVRQGFEGAAKVICFAAKPSPFRHWQDEIDAGFVGHDADLDHVVPIAAPTLGRRADRKAAVTIGVE